MERDFVIVMLVLSAILSGCVQQAQPASGGKSASVLVSGDAVASPDRVFIAKTADVPAGATFDFSYGGDKAILVNFNGQYTAYVNRCTHKGGPVKLEEAVVRCQWHGAEFDPSTGAVLKGPAAEPLTQIPVSLVGDGVYAT